MKVAIQGETGSFSHEAVRQMIPGGTIVPCARSAEVFDRLERGSVALAVIPIENSLAGSVTEHFDLLLARARPCLPDVITISVALFLRRSSAVPLYRPSREPRSPEPRATCRRSTRGFRSEDGSRHSPAEVRRPAPGSAVSITRSGGRRVNKGHTAYPSSRSAAAITARPPNTSLPDPLLDRPPGFRAAGRPR